MRLFRSPLALSLALPLCSLGIATDARAFAPAPEPDDGEETDDEAFDDAPAEEAPPDPAEEKASRQIVGGVVAGSFGFILSIVAFGLAGARATCELEDDPDCARKMGIAALSTGIPGLALMATGGALIGIGVKRRRALRAGSTATVSPWLGRESAGANLTVRF